MSYRGSKKGNYGSQIRYAKKVQSCRSSHARAIDQSLKAPTAMNVDVWLSAPNRFDLPNVDTNKPQKKEAKSMRITESEFTKNQHDFDRLVNKDDIDTKIPKNKEIYMKILATLDKNKIPYFTDTKLDSVDGISDMSIVVPFKNMTRAEKLTDELYKALKKTF